MPAIRPFLKDLWTLTKPYWFSEERWAARGLLAVIIALNLGLVYIDVLLNKWQNGFYNTFQNKDLQGFNDHLWMFTGLAAAYIIAAVYQLYLNQMLQIRWRRWLTEKYLAEWIGGRAYYRMQFTATGTDNPDQRIAEDLAMFVDKTLNLTLGLMSAVVTLVSFLGILWVLSGAVQFTLGGTAFDIPGYMVWVALAYAVIGTWFIHLIGRPLIQLNFNQQKFEANFRFSLVRFRENTEGVALYRGEDSEIRGMRGRFGDLMHNWWEIMKRQKKIMWFRNGYLQAANIFPFIVAAPRFFAGKIQLGDLMQTASAFGKVQEALSWFITAYTQLADWKATVDRLTGFHNAAMLAQAANRNAPGIAVTEAPASAFSTENMALNLPDGQPLLEPFALTLQPGTSTLITGASGAGKSTLFRALAGIWPFGHGTVRKPAGKRVLFLPQKPYLIIGTLRAQLAYPAASEIFSDEELKQALVDCGLPHLAERLDDEQHWAQQLSGGEQQRVGFARALLNKPDWLFMDEATASLDEVSEEKLYTLLRERLPSTTVISIGHRPTLRRFHQQRIEIQRENGGGRVVFA
jgi:putative ATP-binding cassette transporter